MDTPQVDHGSNAIDAGDVDECASPDAPALVITEGTCHAIFAYSIGLSVDLGEAERRISCGKQREHIKHKHRAPLYFEYDPPPLRVTRKSSPVAVGPVVTDEDVNSVVYEFGAVSVAYTIPLRGRLSDLLDLSDALYDHEGLLADSRRRAVELLRTIEPAVIKPGISELVEEYAIYEVSSTRPQAAPDCLVSRFRQEFAQVLRAERTTLSEQEVGGALGCRLSFSPDDAVLIDWNATLILDGDTDDVRSVLEYANVELMQLRFLDDRLDRALRESYSAVTKRSWRVPVLLGLDAGDLRRVAELQMDSALLFEGVNNTVKLLGDQYLARVYRAASDRMHLGEWDTSILRKLQTLESFYEKMSDRRTNRRMEVLEWIIIVLIAVSILVSFIPGLPG